MDFAFSATLALTALCALWWMSEAVDPAFAALLSGSIRNDMLPENAWAVAPRETLPALADFISGTTGFLSIWALLFATYAFTVGIQSGNIPRGASVSLFM